MGIWLPITRELLYGIGFLLFLLAIIVVAVMIKRKRDGGAKFSTSRIFKGKNLERAGKSKKDLDANYDDMPIVGLKWQEDGSKDLSNLDYGDDDDEEGAVDDGYTVVEKAIQEKIQKFQTDPPKKQVASKKEEPKKPKIVTPPVKKDATGDKMDFFTTGKSAL